MVIKTIELSDFRNYNILSIHFDKGTNILYGDNAQGKTNILEAIYLCATTRSHKGSKDREMIRIGGDESHIRLTAEKGDMPHTVDMHLKKSRAKGIAIDAVPIRKSSQLIGLVNVVLFSPEDLSIIKSGPGERRRFLNMELCQLDKIYLHNLTKYNKIINQRNNLLKQISFNRELFSTLSVWDAQLVECGSCIIERRKQFIEEINELIGPIHRRLSGEREELNLQYEPSVEIDAFARKMEESVERDILMKTTGIGPHRDDVGFVIKGADIRKFGSQGQQRTAALSLKLSEIELLKRQLKENPILLLDDVLSELDRNRQNYLLESIEGIQTIITCTGLEEFVNNRLNINKIYKVVEGTVTAENSLK